MAEKRKSQTDEEAERLLEQIQEKMQTWSSLARDVKVPADFQPALMTGRPELMRLVKPRELSAADSAVFIDLIACLLETNSLLQQHASLVAKVVNQVASNARGTANAVVRLEHYANFVLPPNDEDDEE